MVDVNHVQFAEASAAPPAAPLPVSEPGPQPPDDSPPSTPYPAAAPPVQAPVAPPCVDCGGAGEVFTHADDCESDLCALNGDIHSCTGQIEPCHCVGPVAPAAAPLPVPDKVLKGSPDSRVERGMTMKSQKTDLRVETSIGGHHG